MHLLVAVEAVLGCCEAMWHCWQSHGLRVFSRLACTEPCGRWQSVQSSRTGACSHRKGPRFSWWQV